MLPEKSVWERLFGVLNNQWGGSGEPPADEPPPDDTPPDDTPPDDAPPADEPPPDDTLPTETEEEKFARLAKEKGFIPQSAIQPRIDELVREREEAKREVAAAKIATGGQGGQPAAKKDEYSEEDLARMVDYYGNTESEHHNPQYAKWASDKLTDFRIEKKTREILGEEKRKASEAEVVRGRQEALVRAIEQYPDLRNPQSALYIVADSIYRSKPWYMIDPEGLDIAVKKAADQLGILPKSGASALAKEKKKLMKEQDKVSLAGGGRKATPPSPTSQLEKLEAKAVASGEERDWTAYIKAVNAHNAKKESK